MNAKVNVERWQNAGKKAMQFVMTSQELTKARGELQRRSKYLIEKVESSELTPSQLKKIAQDLQNLLNIAKEKASQEEQLFKLRQSNKDADVEEQALNLAQSSITLQQQIANIADDSTNEGTDINFVFNDLFSEQVLNSLKAVKDEVETVVKKAKKSNKPLNQFELGNEAIQAYSLSKETISHWHDYTPAQKVQAASGVLMQTAGLALLVASAINPALGLTSAGLLLLGLGGILCKHLVKKYRNKNDKPCTKKERIERQHIGRSLSTLRKEHGRIHREETNALKVNHQDCGLTRKPSFLDLDVD